MCCVVTVHGPSWLKAQDVLLDRRRRRGIVVVVAVEIRSVEVAVVVERGLVVVV
jgi:hypothetical protein